MPTLLSLRDCQDEEFFSEMTIYSLPFKMSNNEVCLFITINFTVFLWTYQDIVTFECIPRFLPPKKLNNRAPIVVNKPSIFLASQGPRILNVMTFAPWPGWPQSCHAQGKVSHANCCEWTMLDMRTVYFRMIGKWLCVVDRHWPAFCAIVF